MLIGSGRTADRSAGRTVAVVSEDEMGLPRLLWTGPDAPGLNASGVAVARDHSGESGYDDGNDPGSVALLPEVARLWFGRPGLGGYRIGDGAARPAVGQDWATAFVTETCTGDGSGLLVEAADQRSGLRLRTEIQACPGGALRTRHTLTNAAAGLFVVDHIEVVYPVADQVTEALDLTGRWGRERSPQRHRINDGIWLREGRTGRPNFDSPTVLIAGAEGFGFGRGLVYGLHVAWSGNSRHAVERMPSGLCLLRGGELLLPGEIVLGEGECYQTPWVLLAAANDGLDGLAEQWHGYARAMPAHPATPRPVMCNVWEATYFDHDLDRLTALADRAAEVGVERFVLDDGWFGGRRNDTAGLGDWYVSPQVWPDGLGPLIERVTAHGMEFGLWFEPEMVNPDSDLYRSHPDWVLSIGDRVPRQSRNQLVLDLGQADVREYLFDRISALLSEYAISYVKWDHNRALADAGSTPRGDAAGVHESTLGYYSLLSRLRAAHPNVEWESCASGGGRIDLGVIGLVQRFWTSDMTDALSRQLIQRWTGQLVPPEYQGAHVSAPVNHQTGRQLSLDFRAATAFFGSMGIEWDLTRASTEDRARLAEWVRAYKQHRNLLHGGRSFRCDTTQSSVYGYGVVAPDGSEAMVAYVQLDEQVPVPEPLLIPGLFPDRDYVTRQVLSATGSAPWAAEGRTFSGAVLAQVGLAAPARGPETAAIFHLVQVGLEPD
jgi:alpha-galactosidase